MVKLSDFDYNLPKELIANSHCEPRDHSRLLVVNRFFGGTRDKSAGFAQGLKVEHKKFYNILDFLKKGDVLVFNNSKVFKARIFGKRETGGQNEFLLIRPIDDFLWETIIKRKIKLGDKINFGRGLMGEVVKKIDERVWQIRFNKNQSDVFGFLEKHGTTPLPPYVKNAKIKKGFYQTVYAKNTGSVAAPTAGFHFTPELLDKLKKKGIKCLEVTLHVGPGTFLPVEFDDVKKHKMHKEFFEVKKEVWNKIISAKKDGRRIVAVGTTTCRVLEHLGKEQACLFLTKKDLFGSTDIFIYPPYDFKIVDGLITNFHLPKSTLLILVSAFLDPKGKKGIVVAKDLYQKAVAECYRFYSFGDAMLIV